MITFIHNKKNKNEIKVKLDNRVAGTIRCGIDGMYRYYPKGHKTGGDPFLSLQHCCMSVAGDEPWEIIYANATCTYQKIKEEQ